MSIGLTAAFLGELRSPIDDDELRLYYKSKLDLDRRLEASLEAC